MNYIREIVTRDTTIRLRADGIVETRNTSSLVERHEIADAKAVMAAVIEISDGKLLPLLNILGDTYVSAEAQKFYKDHPVVAKASGMVVKSFMQRLIGNLFLKYSALPIPMKLFENEEKAAEWLLGFIVEDQSNNVS